MFNSDGTDWRRTWLAVQAHPKSDGNYSAVIRLHQHVGGEHTHWEARRGLRRLMLYVLFQLFLPCRFLTPSSWSIICSSRVWSSALSGATLMSRTALNSPQLFRCSFSNRKKFQTNRLGVKEKSIFFNLPIWVSGFHVILNSSLVSNNVLDDWSVTDSHWSVTSSYNYPDLQTTITNYCL